MKKVPKSIKSVMFQDLIRAHTFSAYQAFLCDLVFVGFRASLNLRSKSESITLRVKSISSK